MLRRPLEEIYVKLGYATFSPPGAWCGDMSEQSEETIKRGNDTILGMSDLIVIRHLQDVESLGTNAELELACSLGLRIVVVCGGREGISDAIAWANPIVGGSQRSKVVQVEYAFLNKGYLETVSVITYDPVQDVLG